MYVKRSNATMNTRQFSVVHVVHTSTANTVIIQQNCFLWFHSVLKLISHECIHILCHKLHHYSKQLTTTIHAVSQCCVSSYSNEF